MGVHAVAMPRLGMTMQEGTIVEWPVSVGGSVAKGELLLIIETEKAETEIEATTSVSSLIQEVNWPSGRVKRD